MIDVTKYEPAIKKLMDLSRVRPAQREDMLQECYLALLEKLETEDEEQAILISSRRISELRSRESRRAKIARTESLSDPRTAHKAAKVQMRLGAEIPEEKVDDAVRSLPYDIYQVIYSLFVEGRTQEQTAADLKLSRKMVRTRSEQGIKMLKKIFEVA